SGRITGTPTTIGTYTVRVAVSDGVRTTSRTFTWTITGKLAITALTSNKASPQKAGTLIIFAVTVSGGTSPYQYKWWLSDGTNTTQLTNWGSHPSYAWTPHQAKSNYHVTVWARSSGSTSDAADGSRSISFAITSGTSGSRLHFGGVSADVRSPQPVGTAINLKAGATGGVTPYQYKWWLWDGAVWKVIRSWSTRSTLTWTP